MRTVRDSLTVRPDYPIPTPGIRCGVCEEELVPGVDCEVRQGRPVHPECEGGRVRALWYAAEHPQADEQMALLDWNEVR